MTSPVYTVVADSVNDATGGSFKRIVLVEDDESVAPSSSVMVKITRYVAFVE